ncbi:MAG: hypothetical protein IKT40_08840 [Bacilli bacterium]|nr:hypothetical protein [Bacilli bacterium]
MLKNTKLVKKTNVANMVIFFVKEINEKLKSKGWSRSLIKDDFVMVNSKDYHYCWDAINLIQRYLSDDNWECRMTHYIKNNNVGSYTWNFRRKNKKSVVT